MSNEPSDEAIRHTLDYLHQKAKSVNAVTVTEADAVRPMMEVRRECDLPGTNMEPRLRKKNLHTLLFYHLRCPAAFPGALAYISGTSMTVSQRMSQRL